MYLNEFLKPAEYFVDVPDCIFSGDDYRELIVKALSLSNSQLVLESFSASKDHDGYIIEVIVNSTVLKVKIPITSDYVNDQALVDFLNEIKSIKKSLEEYEYFAMDEAVVDFGIAFITKEKYIEIQDKAIVKSRRKSEQVSQETKRSLNDFIELTNELDRTSDPMKRKKIIEEVKKYWNIDLENR